MAKSPHSGIKKAFRKRGKHIEQRAALLVRGHSNGPQSPAKKTNRTDRSFFLFQLYLNHVVFVRRLALEARETARREGSRRIQLRHIDQVAPRLLAEFRG